MSVSDPDGARPLPSAFQTEYARLTKEVESARNRMRRIDLWKYFIWAAAGVVMIIGLVTPWDVTGLWLVLALGVCFCLHSWTAAAWSNATARFSTATFQVQFMAATAMRDAIERGEIGDG